MGICDSLDFAVLEQAVFPLFGVPDGIEHCFRMQLPGFYRFSVDFDFSSVNRNRFWPFVTEYIVVGYLHNKIPLATLYQKILERKVVAPHNNLLLLAVGVPCFGGRP
ncbi:hypothetical protein [Mesorhizobium sp. YR577]|uniref:hypothetical protein n=1 Tax=Mesorhizobium sp. YR577 TaxID=1884373 RepID=UPI0011148CAE|nr:hypothetical protein [Mesorhizobium sp. YR577]